MTGDPECRGCVCYEADGHCVFMYELVEYRYMCPCRECLIKVACTKVCVDRHNIKLEARKRAYYDFNPKGIKLRNM